MSLQVNSRSYASTEKGPTWHPLFYLVAVNENDMKTPLSREELHKRVIGLLKAKRGSDRPVKQNSNSSEPNENSISA